MKRIGRYEVLKELGRGSMGAVYKARDPQIGRTVAIKIILTANLSAEDLDRYCQRFQREAQAAGQMSHPGIVTIHDIAQDDSGQPYLVMEFIEGTPLDRLLAAGAGRLPLERALDIGLQVAQALDYAHRRGVIHRDIKPANILLTSEGRAKIADFGIAKLGDTQLTQAGQMMGTPAFMSPEQFSGGTVDPRSDLFSLGAMLYWMTTGERPFAGDTLTVVSYRIVHATPLPACQADPTLPADVDTVLSRCLAKNPDDRYPSCRELALDLEALKEGRPLKTQPVAVAPMDRTVGVPVLGTTATPTPMVEATEKQIPIVGVPVTPVGFWTSGKRKAAIGALLVLILLLVGYAFWPHSGEEAPVVTEPVAAPPAAKQPTPKSTATPTRQTSTQQPAATPKTTEEILREKGEEILRQQAEEILGGQKKKKPGRGKGRRP